MPIRDVSLSDFSCSSSVPSDGSHLTERWMLVEHVDEGNFLWSANISSPGQAAERPT
jgi:hypothetical protein